MSKYLEQDIIKAFLGNEDAYLTALYRDAYPLILRLVVGNKGRESDAKDILQEAMLIVLTKIQDGNFTLSCGFNTYLYAICKNLWLKHLRNTRNHDFKIVEISEVEDMDYMVNIESEFKYNNQYFLYQKHFETLSQICKDILKLFFEKKSFADIASSLELANYDYARKKKYKCLKVLINRIKKDPEYKKLNHD